MFYALQYTKEMIYEETTVTQRKDGRWFCRVPLGYTVDENGKKQHQYKSIYGVDRNDTLIKRGEFIEQQIKVSKEQEFTKDLLTTKLREWLYHKKYKKIKPNSFDRLEVTLNFQILPALHDLNLQGIKLAEVTVTHIDRIMEYNLSKGYSYSTLKKIRSFFNAFFKHFDDEIPKNPMIKYEFYRKESVIEQQQELKEQKELAISKIQQQKAEIASNGTSKILITDEERLLARLQLTSQTSMDDIHFFSDEEIAKIKHVIENGYHIPYQSRSGNWVQGPLYYPIQGKFFLFWLYAGLRCGEAISLRYSDFDFVQSTVNISKNTVNVKARGKDGKATGKRKKMVSSVKTKNSDAAIYIPPHAMQYIQELQAEEPQGYDGYVLHTKDGKPLTDKAIWQRLSKLLKGAGIQACGTHSLRHTCATKLYEQTGGDIELVSSHLRHGDSAFTARTYVHQSDTRAKEIMSKVII